MDKHKEENSDDKEEAQTHEKPEEGCPTCKKKHAPKEPQSVTQAKSKVKGDFKVKPDGSKKPYEKKKVPKKQPKVNWCSVFKSRKGEFGSERHTLGVPQSVKISVDMKLKDMNKICEEPEKKPKDIVSRLKAYNVILEKFLNLNADEKSELAKTMRDSYTLKLVKGSKKKMDKLTWQIIMNMDM